MARQKFESGQIQEALQTNVPKFRQMITECPLGLGQRRLAALPLLPVYPEKLT
jgi:hypothetical protein